MCERRDTWGAFQGFFLLFALFEWQKLDLMCRKLDMMTTVQRHFSYSSARHDCLIAFKYTSRTHNRSEVTNFARHILTKKYSVWKSFFFDGVEMSFVELWTDCLICEWLFALCKFFGGYFGWKMRFLGPVECLRAGKILIWVWLSAELGILA